MNRKGQANFQNFFGLATGVAALAIILTVAFLILAEGRSTSADNVATFTISNESVAGWSSNVTRAAFGSTGEVIPSTVACTAVWNGSTLVGSGNYTCNDGGILFVGANNSPTWNYTALVSYTAKNKSRAWNGTATMTNATQDVPGWVPLIIIAVIGATLLGIVSVLRRRN